MKRDRAAELSMPIETEIRTLRRERVILDADLARIYGVTTKRLNEQVKRNPDRFPSDFVIRFTKTEWKGLTSQSTKAFSSANRSQIATGSQKHRDPRFLPYAFTEHGAIMAANVLNSPRAVQMSVFVVRAFVRLRQMVTSHKEMAAKLAELERKVASHDGHIKALNDAIRQLMTPPETKKRKIGFLVKEKAARYGRSRGDKIKIENTIYNRVLKNSAFRPVKKVPGARRARNRRDEAYLGVRRRVAVERNAADGPFSTV